MHPQYYVFSLPPEILDILTPRHLFNRPQSPLPEEREALVIIQKGSRACNICQEIAFSDVYEQRNHFRSDWHRYNVKLRLNGGQPVSEPAFAKLVDALEDSISGSASSSDTDGSSTPDAVDNLVQKSKKARGMPESLDDGVRSAPLMPITWFHAPPSTQFGVYRSLFSPKVDPQSQLSELKKLQTKDRERTWAMFMVAGGHFAAALVRVNECINFEEQEAESSGKKKRPKKQKSEIEVLRHKTFHRYTTRRKQGGAQSVNDNAKGYAKSAGAQLRRYGEQALKGDIRGLIAEWAEDINDCDLIWMRAGVSARKIFFDFEGTPISKRDPRLRTFPFPTRRPTQSELVRCLNELVWAKVSHLTEETLRLQDEAYLESLPKPKIRPIVLEVIEPIKIKQPKLSKEEELYREKWIRLLEMVIKGRLEPLKAFWEREASSIGGINVQVPVWTGEKRASLLQVASEAGSEDVVRWLLEEAQADPTIPVSVERLGEMDEDDTGVRSDVSDAPKGLAQGTRRVAYDLARSKNVRDVFRRCAAANPDLWDWLGAARVPSILSLEMEEERDEKKKVRRKGLKERVKERVAKKESEKPVLSAPVEAPPKEQPIFLADSTSQRLGGGAGFSEGISGLTPEMRAKVERERRARAAEARMKAGRKG